MALENWEKDIEDWTEELKDAVESGIAAALAAITAAKGDGLDLTVPRSFVTGSRTLEGDYPLCAFAGTEEVVDEDMQTGQIMTYSFTVDVVERDRGDGEEKLEKRVQRYAKAVRYVLEDNYKRILTVPRVQYSPAVTVSPPDALFKMAVLSVELKMNRSTASLPAG